MKKLIGAMMVIAGMAGHAFAGSLVPEIDASSGIAAVGLLSGGLLILRARKKK
jgi:hypothetical protein